MVTLVVATTTDPASYGPASALSALGNWNPGVSFQSVCNGGTATVTWLSITPDLGVVHYRTNVVHCGEAQRGYSDGERASKVNGEVRLLEHDKGIVEEDHLDNRWEDVTGEVVHEIIFLSKHTAVTNRPALTIHPIGVPHLKEGDVPPQGGKPGWAAVPSPRMTPWLILLKKLAESHNLVPEFEITLEATHHGPVTTKPTMFVEIGSTIECWTRQDAAQVVAQLVWEGLGIGGGEPIGNWNSTSGNKKVLLGVGGGHYVPRHMDIVLKGNVWVGHLLSGYSLPMEDPDQSRGEKNSKDIGGTWKHAIKAAYDATVEGFPGGEIIAHLDQKSFKGWQKKAITEYLSEQNIKICKPGDFY